jgi:hypothetical protein
MVKQHRITEVTLLEALSNCFQFNPKKKIGSSIQFNIVFYDDLDNPETEQTKMLRFGKYYSKLEHDWVYFEGQTYYPTFTTTEQDMVSNLFCGEVAKHLIYGARQQCFKVFLTDSK